MTPDTLKTWREALGLTQREAADALGMAPKNYGQLEAGRNFVTGKATAIDRRTALACAAISAGLKPIGEH